MVLNEYNNSQVTIRSRGFPLIKGNADFKSGGIPLIRGYALFIEQFDKEDKRSTYLIMYKDFFNNIDLKYIISILPDQGESS